MKTFVSPRFVNLIEKKLIQKSPNSVVLMVSKCKKIKMKLA